MSPMGIVSDSDFLNEFNNSGVEIPVDGPGPITGSIEEIKQSGRSEGDTNVPDVLRKIIGEHSQLEGRSSALELAGAFGISPSSVSAYNAGATSTATIDKPKDELIEYLNDRKKKLSKRAMKKLGIALARLDNTKLADCTGPQLAHVALTMSNVVKNLEPSSTNSSDNDRGVKAPVFVIMTPQVKSEDAYAVIHSRE
jgi:hypothetical protein